MGEVIVKILPFESDARCARPVLFSSVLGMLILLGGLVTATPSARAQILVENLIVNGDFDSDLSHWNTYEDAEWDSLDYQGSPGSGSATYFDLGAAFGQCMSVESGRYYGAFGRAYTWGDKDDILYVNDITGESCPSSRPDSAEGFFGVDYIGAPQAWAPVGDIFLMPTGITDIALTFNATSHAFGFPHHWDHIEFGKVRPDISVTMPVSETELVPLQEFTIDVTYSSQYNGVQPDLRVFHDGRISLVSHVCDAGFINDVSQGGNHYFLWSGIPEDLDPYAFSCTITARAKSGFAGTFDLHAVADCEDCDLDINLADNEQTIEMEILARPDMTAALELPEFPEASDLVEIQLVVENQGTALEIADMAVTTSMPLSLVNAGGINCGGFSTIDAQTFESSTWLGSDESAICDLSFQVPPDQEQAALTVQAFAVASGDYDPGNNNDSASTRLVRLRVNRSIDGSDRAPGDGICEGTADAGNCSLRTAVMEANALQAATGRTFTVELPHTLFSYTLTRTTGDDAALYGSLQINRRMNLVGVPGENGQLPLVIAQFPSADADRLIQIGNPAGFVRIENIHLRGQGLVPTDTDGLGTDGGLILHRSGELVLRNVSLADGVTDGDGGAIYSVSDDVNGHLKLDRVRVFDNTADSYGGGIYFAPESVSLFSATNSEIHDNMAGIGGGLVIIGEEPGSLPIPAIDSSTIYANEAFVGGGVFASEVPSISIHNSTISGNTAVQPGGVGGGVAARTSTGLQIHNSTVAFNQAAPGDPDIGRGGGIDLDSGATATLYNSIVSGNTARLECSQTNPPICVPRAADCFGTVDSAGYNAMNSSIDTECHLNDTTGDYNGGVSLAALADNGGPTPTHAPDAIAQIVDAGDPVCMTSPGGDLLLVDQRGALRPADGDDSGIAQCDRGAYELSESARITVVVDDDSLGRVNSSPGGIACGAGTGNQCSALFAFDTEVTLTATVAGGSGGKFSGWLGACAGQDSVCTIQASGETDTTALFMLANQPDFALACDDNHLTATTGDMAQTTCHVESIDGFDATVSLSCNEEIGTLHCQLGQATITPPVNGSESFSLSVDTGATAPGDYAIVAEGTAASVTRQALLLMSVEEKDKDLLFADSFEN